METSGGGEQAAAERVRLSELSEQVRSWSGHLRTWQTPAGERMLQISMPLDLYT